MRVMGLEDWQVIDSSHEVNSQTPKPHKSLRVINLLHWDIDPEEKSNDSLHSETKLDPWMTTAVQIQLNIEKMTSWIRRKQYEYVQLDISEEEASLIQTTVASFTATTASEIETLNQCISSFDSSTQKQQHCTGIAQILMTELREGIAEPFGRLTKQRHRAAVNLWHTPLQCRLRTIGRKVNIGKSPRKEKDITLELLGINEDDEDDEDNEEHKRRLTDQKFHAKRPSHRLHRNFLQSYDITKTERKSIPRRPDFLFRSYDAEDEIRLAAREQKSMSSFFSQKSPKARQETEYLSSDIDDEVARAASSAVLQQESILLQAKTQSDLDSIQKMEQTMVDITALLSQFANLVSEQQEDVWEIHDATTSTKENLEKGQKNLHDAKARTAASKHYMAKAITAMGVVLLFLNWIKP